MKSEKKPARFYELDLLRFLAALGVVMFHYTFLDVIENKSAPSYPFFESIFKYGYFGVEFFFMISGFVILLTAQKKNWQGFIISRVSRLYPAFWIAVSITSLGILLLSTGNTDLSLSQYLWNLTMVPEYVGMQDIDSPYWTLQVEIKFYFWVFIILLLNKIHHVEKIIFAWLMLSILDIFHIAQEFNHYFFIPDWAPYFSAGALFYIIKTKGLNSQRITLLALTYLLSLYFAIDAVNFKTGFYKVNFSPIVITLLLSFYYVIFAFIISEKIRHIQRAWFVTLGGISYPLYLVHNKLGELLFIKFSFINNRYLLLLLIISIVMILSFVLYRYFEKRIAFKMKEKLNYCLNQGCYAKTVARSKIL